jgi:NAD(P)-dependent dehydrogenase (short-subunit alcohol dehydrogenase family)
VDFPVALISDWEGIAGREICHALAGCEFSLIVNGPQEEVFDLQSHDYPGKILAFPFDFTSEEAVEMTLSATLDIFGHVDVLVNNIHHWVDAKFMDLTDEQFLEAYSKNVVTSFHVCRATARLMEALGYGKIINVTSTSAFTGAHTPLAASCAAVHSLTRSIANEMAPHIRCNTIACGLIEEDWVKEAGDELKKSLTSGVPLRRLCQPHDVAELVALLATGADFMTGQMLVLDGGESIRF